MRVIHGDFWSLRNNGYDAIVCTINTCRKRDGSLVMGKGIAADFARYYPWLPAHWGKTILNSPPIMVAHEGVYVDYDADDSYLIGMITKHDWKKPSTYQIVETSLKALRDVAGILGVKNVLMPPPGCGNGGLDWRRVEKLCQQYLDDRFTVAFKPEVPGT